ncbi:hypothetical protein L6E12_27050 [Actinokineospora sp. PR83]|uniref:hypothetical protein n=1 Tax=Actinokineospora sp. PR83 TaxID=2884908 RepID=UPI001F30692B|nr:hypothetical protein [Actinokineospora sp. PR83]MCG8919439.1 hypothetical protein [Actinokineospora sp. PR83]
MSRSSRIRAVAHEAGANTGVEVDAEDLSVPGVWTLSWVDGPTAPTLAAAVAAAGRRLGVPGDDLVEVRYERAVTVRAAVAAAAHRMLRDGAAPPVSALAEVVADTEFGVDAEVEGQAWEVADFVLEGSGMDPDSTSLGEAEEVVRHLLEAGRNGVLVDLWLEHRPGPGRPPVLDTAGVVDDARAAVGALYRRLQDALLTGSAHGADPRARQLAAQSIRGLVAELVLDCQRADAAQAVIDGFGMASLSTEIGLSRSALGKQLGSLDEHTRTLGWMREHAAQWARACHDAADALRGQGTALPAAARDDARRLEHADPDGGWRAVRPTLAPARRLVADVELWPHPQHPHRRALLDLLDALDAAAPPTRAERHQRRPFTPGSRDLLGHHTDDHSTMLSQLS